VKDFITSARAADDFNDELQSPATVAEHAEPRLPQGGRGSRFEQEMRDRRPKFLARLRKNRQPRHHGDRRYDGKRALAVCLRRGCRRLIAHYWRVSKRLPVRYRFRSDIVRQRRAAARSSATTSPRSLRMA
jgi:hypothetical protein